MDNDPLNELLKSPEYIKGYNNGYKAGYKDVEDDMAGDYDLGEKKGFERGSKYLFNVIKIANQWNIREISADEAIAKILKYLRLKVKKVENK